MSGRPVRPNPDALGAWHALGDVAKELVTVRQRLAEVSEMNLWLRDQLRYECERRDAEIARLWVMIQQYVEKGHNKALFDEVRPPLPAEEAEDNSWLREPLPAEEPPLCNDDSCTFSGLTHDHWTPAQPITTTPAEESDRG